MDALFERYQPALRALVSRGVPADEVDDVVQESLLQAVRALPEFCYRGPGSFRAWLLRITERRIIDRYRRSAVGPELADETVSRLAHGHTPSGPAVARELIEARRQLLDGLPAVDRDLVKLRQEDGLGFAAIAAQLGLTGARAASRRYSELVSRYPELRGEA